VRFTFPGRTSLAEQVGEVSRDAQIALARDAREYYSRSMHNPAKGNGHVSYDKSSCAKALINAYLIDLTLPDAGTVCR
jgi:hypothetical protein